MNFENSNSESCEMCTPTVILEKEKQHVEVIIEEIKGTICKGVLNNPNKISLFSKNISYFFSKKCKSFSLLKEYCIIKSTLL